MSAQRHEVLAWLGEDSLYEPDQREQVADEIVASGLDSEADWLAIMERVTGVLDLPALAIAYTQHAVTAEEARLRLVAAIRQVVVGGMSESEASRVSGVSRMTVRKALGKSPS